MEWRFEAATFVPFRDKEAVARVRAIKREDITKHPNPDFRIQVFPGSEIEFMWLMDMYTRIKTAADNDETCVLITPQPWKNYSRLAQLININKVNCKKLHTFNMDEYADQDGNTAPVEWPMGFMHSMMENFYSQLDPKLAPPLSQVQGPNTQNINDYGKMITDLGGADCCYQGPGWTGHIAFVDPDAPEYYSENLDEWKQQGPKICTLSPFTIAQNSLHGHFGSSGDLTAVPPKAATIGPAQVVEAKHRISTHAITVDGSFASWQRLTTRLALHGPVTPLVPESIIQTLRTDVWLSEAAAADIEPQWDKGY